MVEEDERVADDAGEEADWAGYCGAAELEVAEAAALEGFELGVCASGLAACSVGVNREGKEGCVPSAAKRA